MTEEEAKLCAVYFRSLIEEKHKDVQGISFLYNS